MDIKQKLQARIESLEEQRSEYIRQADMQVAAFAGAIAELKRMLAEMESAPEPEQPHPSA